MDALVSDAYSNEVSTMSQTPLSLLPHSEAAPSEDIANSDDLSSNGVSNAADDFLAPSYSFLEQVKNEFAQDPAVFSSFLRVMKLFELNELDTIGVVNEVIKLFQGKDSLIAQFAMFLPGGHQLVCNENSANEYVLILPALVDTPSFDGAIPSESRATPAPSQLESTSNTTIDHAMDFVSRVRTRFTVMQDDLEAGQRIFQSFLDLLTTIQSQPKSFIEIVHEVSRLFRDQVDLLQEFPCFLPVEVRASASAEIDQIIARRKRLQTAKEKRNGNNSKRFLPPMISNRSVIAVAPLPPPALVTMATTAKPSRNQANQDFQSNSNQVSTSLPLPLIQMVSSARSQHAFPFRVLPQLELVLLQRVKTFLLSQVSWGKRWFEFLKCLRLLESSVLTRVDFIVLIQPWFQTSQDSRLLLESVDRMLASRGITEDGWENACFSLPVAELEFKPDEDDLHRNGNNPSYQFLSRAFPVSSRETQNDQSLLNSDLFVVPQQYNPSTSTSTFMPNQFEDNLRRCEEEQYEMSLLIDSTSSAIDALVRGDMSTLSVLHLKAISQVYGEDSVLVFEYLKKDFHRAAPIIVSRLQRCCEIWKRNEASLVQTVWKDALRDNLFKSLDFQSKDFKANDKKLGKNFIADTQASEVKWLSFPDCVMHYRIATQFFKWATEELPAKEHEEEGDEEEDSSEEDWANVLFQVLSLLLPANTMFSSHLSGFVKEEDIKAGKRVVCRYGEGTVVHTVKRGSHDVQVKLLEGGVVVSVPKTCLLSLINKQSGNETHAIVGGGDAVLGHVSYTFLRFYHVLYERMVKLESLCADRKVEFTDFCRDILFPVLAGKLSAAKFEEQCLTQLGNESYFCFTLDKVFLQVQRSLVNMINEDRALRLAEVSQKYQPDVFHQTLAFRRAVGEALAFPVRQTTCCAVMVKPISGVISGNQMLWSKPPGVELTFAFQVPGVCNSTDLVFEFFEPMQIKFNRVVSIYFSAVYSADCGSRSRYGKAGGNGEWWHSCLQTDSKLEFIPSDDEDVLPSSKKKRRMVVGEGTG